MRQGKLMVLVLFTFLLVCNSALADRFVNLNDGTVLDATTNLRWLRDANCYSSYNGGGDLWDNDVNKANSLATGSCGLTDGSAAGDWHLPTFDELYSLIALPDNYRATNLINAGFTNVGAGYWTSTPNANDASEAWIINIGNGSSGTCGKENCYMRTWPVRNEQYWIQGSLVIGGKTGFGNQLLNSTSTGALTLINTGSNPLAITGITISGSNADQFSLALDAPDACSSLTPSLAASAKCTVTVKATPTSSGSKTATLTLATASGTKDLPLTVTGYAFTVTYAGNGQTSGSAPHDSTNYASGATVTVLGNSGALGKTGYNFNGWNSNTDGSGTNYNVGSAFTITSSVNLYAKWTAAMIVPSGLVSWWRAENDVQDLVSQNNGVATGVTYAAGEVGSAFSFNGTTDNITQGRTHKGIASSSASSSFTMEFWAKPTATITNLAASQTTSGYAGTSGQRYAIFPEMQDSTTEAGAGVSVGTNGIMVTEHAGDYLPAPLVYPLADGEIPTNGWLHIAVVYENQIPKLYINGVLKQTGLSSGRTVYPSSQFGGNSYGFYAGLLDELHIFNRALTVTEIQSIYSVGSAGFSTARINQVITFGEAPTIAVGGNGMVNVTSSSGLPVTLSSLTPAICTINSTVVSGIGQGTCTIAANQPALGIYNQATQTTQSFTIFAAIAPTLTTTAATAITTTSATLNATVNANYSSDTVSFEYGTTTAYGNTATISQSPVSGGTDVSVSAAISNLEFNKTYHYRIKAVNGVTGTTYGNDMAFTTSIRRFVDLADGTMLDTANSLRWLKKANCLGSATFSESNTKSAALASGACELVDGSVAGDWHAPTKTELESLVAAPDSYRYATLNSAGFSGVSGSLYWTSTDYGNGSVGFYYIVNMYSGGTIVDYDKNYLLWPVRTGTFVYSGLTASPAAIDFGSQPINAPVSRNITISNSGGYGNLVVSSITSGGSDSSRFSVGSGTCGAAPITLAPGASCTVSVIFTPATLGAKNATLNIASNGTTTATRNITLNGTGVAPTWPLTVSVSGSGSGTVTSDADHAGIGCPAMCQASFASGAVVTLSQYPSSISTFGGWSGACSSDPCVVTMDAAKNVTASFVLAPLAINKTYNNKAYQTLVDALTDLARSAVSGDELLLLGTSYDSAVSLNKGYILNGGWSATYQTKSDLPTTLNNGLTVTSGASTANTLEVRGQLLLQNGSLKVNGVVVK
ncbi:Abnormal spindle-like microcephaly-assoc'd, ASPM-SPD-2-Hydin [Trichlorobacter thiogenes]|uniref:Abnormal spindle-like microcephaly-assoc'd, ASPM-SPD-2-Hydin n=1 Tax=Trichlorobacter thiogenes TaxID=115783 RepID=A0A1T4NS09_9BACT|nr:DUF1566 domain-containing protein [Trichlorobacter thiogenes]SJZ82091.1 Abnormal spindle-like microcephaly-assoc'd, ASPM-SPD-2-Hydin [Trichlorobacter thiogenes]